MFCLFRTRALSGNIQRTACGHNNMEQSWIDVYTSTDIERALRIGYEIMDYKEIWHYHSGGAKLFRDFILNIMKQKIECSGFPPHCTSDELKEDYVKSLRDQCSIELKVDNIKKDPAGRYLNKIMANSVWGKWAQNPSTQSSLNTCETMRVLNFLNHYQFKL